MERIPKTQIKKILVAGSRGTSSTRVCETLPENSYKAVDSDNAG